MTTLEPIFDEKGLVPCIVQDADRGTVLMLAWMNSEAFRLTIESGQVCFWSRSRQALWRKGETSGHTLAAIEVRIDCDRDAILVRARPSGPACHTNATSCFFRTVDGVTDDGVPAATGAAVLDRLAEIVHARRAATAIKSYTKSLLDAGLPKILSKIAEEHGELAVELDHGDAGAIVHETADLIFHVLVGLEARDVPLASVFAELARRFGTSGHVEKAARERPTGPE